MWAILKSIGDNELRFPEQRQLVSKFSEVGEDWENLFKGEKCNKNKIGTDGYYLGSIIIEVLSKELKIIFGIYLWDDRYANEPLKIIAPNDEEYKGVILLHLNQGVSCQTLALFRH